MKTRSMKTRLVFGSLIAIGLVIGSLLSIFLPGFGIGSGESGGHTRATVSPDSTLAEVDRPATSRENESTDPESEPAKVLDVLVDEHRYAIRISTDPEAEYQTMQLEEVIELAKQTPGNEDGIRVRVAFSKSSRPPREILLKEQLSKAGLEENAVLWLDELVE